MRYLLSLVLLLAIPSSFAGPITVDGRAFRNPSGSQILLRGVNVAGDSKVPPFRPIADASAFEPLRGWGFNSMRLLFNWEAYEPEPGVYDASYLNYYRQMVDWAAQHHLYVIADIHQDAFSRFAVGGCGEGFPEWALPPFQKPATPDNGEKCANWGTRMFFDIGMHIAWHHFHKNTYGVRDRYLLMLERVAAALADAPNLVGFDLLNEPWGIEKTELAQLYYDAGVRLQAIIPNTVLFFSAHALTSTGVIPSQLPPIPLKNAVHATHYYDPSLYTTRTWAPWTLKVARQNWKKLLDRWQTPLYLGEFGARGDTRDALTYVDSIYDAMDQELYSGAIWVYTPGWTDALKDGWNREDFSINDDHGQLRGLYRPRPYVEETPGTLKSMQWDEGKKALIVRYQATVTPEEVRIAIPDRLEWTGVQVPLVGEAQHFVCAPVQAHQLRCGATERGHGTERSFIFLFRERT